ncbi:MAG: tetratricopeptide repeat protein [Bacteroidales bacterium]|nr:tetratricopeptide repeat protein [Bacteroidales bacterium]
MRRLLIYISLALLVLVCTNCRQSGEVKPVLLRADSLLTNNLPDSALSLIGSIPLSQLHSEADKAEFILLYERILEANGLPLIGEEELLNAVAHYQRGGEPVNELLARFYLGQIYEHEGNSYEAMTQYVEAEGIYMRMAREQVKITSSENDLVSSAVARIYVNKGNIYQSKLNFNGALKMYSKALEFDHSMETLGKVAQANEALEKYDQSLEAYLSALSIAQKEGDSKSILLYGSSIAGVKFALGTPSGRVLEELFELYAKYGNSTPPHDNYILLACLYLDNGQISKAKEYAVRYMQEKSDANDIEEAGWASLMSSIAKIEGNYKEALEYQQRYASIMESINEQEKNNSVQEVEQLYYNRQLQIENENMRRQNRSAVIIYSLLVVILLGAVAGVAITWRRKLQQKNRQIGEYLAAAQDAESSKNILLGELDVQKEKEKRLKELLENRFAEIRELAGTYYEFGYSKKLQKKVEQLLSFQSFGQDMFEVIENVVNAKNNGAIEKIRSEFPSITEENIKLLNLIYAGFSPQEISVIINDTPQNIYVRKSRLKRKLAPLIEREPEISFK